jgi:hypothetical protein
VREAPRSNVPLWTDVDRFFSITTRIALFADTCDRPAFEPGFSFRVAYQVAAREAVLMDYEAFTNESLTMMYEGIRGALRADDALRRDARDPPFRIRETLEWKKHAANLEVEMLRRGMLFEVIDWS